MSESGSVSTASPMEQSAGTAVRPNSYRNITDAVAVDRKTRLSDAYKETTAAASNWLSKATTVNPGAVALVARELWILIMILVVVALIMSVIVGTTDDSAVSVGFMSTMWVLLIITIYIKIDTGSALKSAFIKTE